ncbi:MAG: hypothetical protein QW506_02685 [Thermoproteota archaeon]|nr:hypothetical protein [Candidatus Brockarchaeota archaeon]
MLFIIIVSSDSCLKTYATLRKRAFESDWFDTKFRISIESDDTWYLPNDYNVKLEISVYWVGMNYRIWINKINLGLGDPNYPLIEEEKIVDRMLSRVGDTYSTTVTLKSPSTLYYFEPGKTITGSIYISIEGWAEDEHGNRWPSFTSKSYDIDIKAPPISINTGYELSKEAIYVGDQFSLDILVENDNDFPIFNVAAETSPLFTLVVGLNKKSIEKLEPRQTTKFTFYFKAEQAGEEEITTYISYKTSWGYEALGYENKLEVKINIKEKINETLLLIVVALIIIMAGLGMIFYLKTKRTKAVPLLPPPPPPW